MKIESSDSDGEKAKKEKKKDESKKKSADAGKSAKAGDSKQKRPWYADGLRFECSQCGDCCTGEPGYVWVDEAEITAMAVEMEMDIEAFERKFVRRVGRDKSLIEYPDGDCILLGPRTRKCTVYAARPIQCRTWPFWDSNLKKKKDWKETCDVCPGSGTGRLYTFEEIEAARKQKSV